MRNASTEAHNQLKRWNIIRSEWDDQKTDEVENEYIEPMQMLLTYIDEMLCEINFFISETEEKMKDIKEDNSYG